jgi:hypothetical protein
MRDGIDTVVAFLLSMKKRSDEGSFKYRLILGNQRSITLNIYFEHVNGLGHRRLSLMIFKADLETVPERK